MYSTNYKAKKIQALLVNHLIKCGSIELLLPDGVVVEIDTTTLGKNGTTISDDYCVVKTSRDGNSAVLDRYNLGIEYVDNNRSMICMDTDIDDQGRAVKRVEVI